jgi:hypothetical protein
MSSIFKIISSEQWEEAKITGLVPRRSEDDIASLDSGAENSCILICEFGDLELVCTEYFKKSDIPVALEVSPSSYQGLVKWQEPTEEKPWKEGRLYVDHLLADMVLSIYSFEYLESEKNQKFRVLGEE